MPDESCRRCGGQILVSNCRSCKFPVERICRCCENVIRYIYHYCTNNIVSMPYACAASA